jgi:arsenite methyltransferase
VSDIVLTQPLPESIRTSLSSYIGCIAGASLMEDYIGAMQMAGFVNVQVSTKRAFDVLACDDPIVQGVMNGVDEGIDLEKVKESVVSATVIAYKPE